MLLQATKRLSQVLLAVLLVTAGVFVTTETASAITDPQELPDLTGCSTMWEGSRGLCIEALQYSLEVAGLNVQQDGAFGPQTRGAVVAFQAQAGLIQDGIAGPQTLAELDRVANAPDASRSFRNCPQLAVGVTSSCVRRFRLEFSAVDDQYHGDPYNWTVYTAEMAAAVTSYQARNGLVVDGVVGRQTADLIDLQAGPVKVCIATGGDSLNADGSCPRTGAVGLGSSAWDCLEEATLGLPRDLIAEHARDNMERGGVIPKSEALHFLMKWFAPAEAFACVSFGEPSS